MTECEYCSHSSGFWYDSYLQEWKCKWCNGVWIEGDPFTISRPRGGDGLFKEVPDLNSVPLPGGRGSGKNLADLLDEFYSGVVSISK